MAVREEEQCGFKGLNRDAVSRGRHEGRPYGEGSFCRCPEARGGGPAAARAAPPRPRTHPEGRAALAPRSPRPAASPAAPGRSLGPAGAAADWLRRRAEVMLLSPACRAPAEPRGFRRRAAAAAAAGPVSWELGGGGAWEVRGCSRTGGWRGAAAAV